MAAPAQAMAAQGGQIMEKASAGVREIFSALSTSEVRYFDQERYSESELRKGLSDSITERKIDAMKRILAAVSVGRDASALFPDVVKNVSFSSIELKKLIYIYLVQYAENNRELALLSINSFQKDLSNQSQQIRASALRAMASIKVLEVIQLVMVAVRTAAGDSSPYVRKTAAQCMIKVYGVDADQFFELRKLLLKLMNDVEVQVVGSAVMAFRQICVVLPKETAEDGKPGAPADAAQQLELLHPLFKRLVQDMLLMDSWAQICCIDLLTRYCRLFFACPDKQEGKSEAGVSCEDFLAFLKNLKLLLCSSSKGVTLAAAVAICYLALFQDIGCVAMPLMRCLRQATLEAGVSMLSAITPLVEARPELFRAMIREFFVQSFDPPEMKRLKLKVVEILVDETNVQLVLRELQVYVSWHSQPLFVAQAVRSIAQVALKISSVADACLRGLVKMLDSKCEALSCEAVVSLRALLQRRHSKKESGLGSVLPHLVTYLEDLTAPTARASVVWIIGHYQEEVAKLAPDAVRRLAKGFAAERQEVKQQILVLALKVWAFHAMNARGEVPAKERSEVKSKDAGSGKVPPSLTVSPDESAALLPRLEAVVDHISALAALDASWDVRDTARALKSIKESAKAALSSGGKTPLEQMGIWYCRACISGAPPLDAAGVDASDEKEDGSGKATVDSMWMIGSLAQALDFPLETYRPLPPWAEENSSDELRKVKAEVTAEKARENAPKSISSATVGNVTHMEQRVQLPSNITNVPVVQTLEDLDLFYSEATPAPARPAPAPRPQAAAPATTLEQMRLAGAVAPVGTAVFGEDEESDEEAEDDDDWKYCQQAASANPTSAYPPATAPEPPAAPLPQLQTPRCSQRRSQRCRALRHKTRLL
ncbi:unnamed protein product [Effrenium voratum]|nr:unnamed protein product [Effrenium voratum]